MSDLHKEVVVQMYPESDLRRFPGVRVSGDRSNAMEMKKKGFRIKQGRFEKTLVRRHMEEGQSCFQGFNGDKTSPSVWFAPTPSAEVRCRAVLAQRHGHGQTPAPRAAEGYNCKTPEFASLNCRTPEFVGLNCKTPEFVSLNRGTNLQFKLTNSGVLQFKLANSGVLQLREAEVTTGRTPWRGGAPRFWQRPQFDALIWTAAKCKSPRSDWLSGRKSVERVGRRKGGGGGSTVEEGGDRNSSYKKKGAGEAENQANSKALLHVAKSGTINSGRSRRISSKGETIQDLSVSRITKPRLPDVRIG
ncbi:Folate synthesis bifunctional protein [Frankliniella fusca]|uniref:Folate synthesis bifunctional protein n=1 Tax=Frankliniella fusca TaxID=407009 RepID=A0AAE1I3M6_9NEOP|nr:Folate synthesis bifunctional protein [Frankliniella fusca]